MKKFVKSILFGKSSRQMKIKFGIGKGIQMAIDPAHKSQRIIGLDEIEIQKYFKSFAKNSRAFVDVGSSDGYYGLIYKKYNPQGVIVSCEAQTSFESVQRENYKTNNIDLGNTFHYNSEFIGSRVENNWTSVDNLVKKYRINDIFLKIDIDGGELEALQGSIETLKNINCKLIIETHSLQLEKDCIALLEGIGYKCKIVKNGFIRNFVPERRIVSHNRWFVATK